VTGESGNASALAARIEHTTLRAEATAADIRRLCAEAREHRFVAVCVNPVRVRLAVAELAGSGVRVCSVVGFPLGASLPEVKAEEARRARDEGAGEIDMVMNIGVLRDGDPAAVRDDVASVRHAVGGGILKVILETAILGPREIELASVLAVEAGADFVKTSTGFNAAGGAQVEHVRLIRRAIGERAGI